MMPASVAFLRILVLLSPRPSSVISMTMLPRLVIRLELELAGAALPAVTRSSGCLDAVIGGVADHVHQRIADRLDDVAVQFRLAAIDDEFDFLVALRARSRTRRAIFWKTPWIGTMRIDIDRS